MAEHIPQEEGSQDSRARQLLGVDRSKVTREELDRVFTSPDSRAAISNIKAETLPPGPAAEHKKRIALEIGERKLLDPEILKSYPCVYIGSGVDVEYPLALGNRNITLLDPALDYPDRVAEVKKRIEALTGEKPEQKAGIFHFNFDFGTGDEKVSVTIDPRVYGLSAEREAEGKYKKFVPPEEIGMLLGFQTSGTELASDPKSMEHVVHGGYLLTNHRESDFFTTLKEIDSESLTKVKSDVTTKNNLLKQVYAKKGFSFLPLEGEGDSFQYVFAKKNNL